MKLSFYQDTIRCYIAEAKRQRSMKHYGTFVFKLLLWNMFIWNIEFRLNIFKTSIYLTILYVYKIRLTIFNIQHFICKKK